jgi:hypothetical protein
MQLGLAESLSFLAKPNTVGVLHVAGPLGGFVTASGVVIGDHQDHRNQIRLGPLA